MKLKKLLAAALAVTVAAAGGLSASAAGIITNHQPLAGQSWTEGDSIYCEEIVSRIDASLITSISEIQIDIVTTELATDISGAAGELYICSGWTGVANCPFGPDGYGDVGAAGTISATTVGTGLNILEFSKSDDSAFFATDSTNGTFIQITAWDGTFSVEDVRYYNASGELLNTDYGVVAATDNCNILMNVDGAYNVDTSGVPATDTIVGLTFHVSPISANDGEWYWGGGAVQFTINGDTTEFAVSLDWDGLSANDADIYVALTNELIDARTYADLIQFCYYFGSGNGSFTLKSVDIHVVSSAAKTGDVDADNDRDCDDVVAVKRHVLGLVCLNQDKASRADINGDAVLNVVDALALARHIEGIFDIDAIGYAGSALEFVANMGFGWNLGNSFDSYNEGSSVAGESGWGNPIVTKSLIQAVKGYGFTTIRIPVTWMEHMSANGTIDTNWMLRVKTVVDYAIDEGMYVIINTHWDCSDGEESWISDYATDSSVLTKFANVWTQIGNQFIGYDEHLVFEGMNEVGFDTLGTAQAYTLLNNLNTTFVNTVRAQGGWNAERLLLIAGYWTDIDDTCDMLSYVTLPDDDFMAVSCHYYNPYYFCIQGSQTTWTSENSATVDSQFAKLKTNFINRGIPIIIGEYGYANACQASSCCTMVDKILTVSESLGICAIIWDQGSGNPVIERTSGSYSMTKSGLSTVFANHR